MSSFNTWSSSTAQKKKPATGMDRLAGALQNSVSSGYKTAAQNSGIPKAGTPSAAITTQKSATSPYNTAPAPPPQTSVAPNA